MKKTFELEIDSDGTIRTIYQDGIEEFAEDLGAEVAQVCRASNVEWEEVSEPINKRFPATKGWSVRSAKNGLVALRHKSDFNPGIGERYIDSVVCSSDTNLGIILFSHRDDALEYEEKFFWQLMYGKDS